MATLFRNSRSIMKGLSCIRRTAATARPAHGTEMAVRDARQRVAPADAIKPRAAGEPPLM
jgi:hypothetical protein